MSIRRPVPSATAGSGQVYVRELDELRFLAGLNVEPVRLRTKITDFDVISWSSDAS
jgi:hypothetical protein